MPLLKSDSCADLIDLVRARAAQQPEQRAYTFLKNGENEQTPLSYRELDRRARAIAATLQADRAVGERALLLYPPGLEFISAFIGCLYAGIVAVPSPLPDQVRLKNTLPRLRSLIEDAQASVLLTDEKHLAPIADSGALPGLELMATDRPSADDSLDRLASGWQRPSIGGDDLAYLQYTSGSTSSPKGVMVTHGNLLRHCQHVQQAWDYRPDDVAATWLPHFHDYGLVDGLLLPLHAGIPSFVMSPISFFARPVRWLNVISRYRVTHSQGPNFAYDYCVEKINPSQCDGLDLACWRTASNGAEPIEAATIERFIRAFAPFGFRREAVYPAYGLAEATLLVTTRRHSSLPASCVCDAGALEQHRVVEVDPDRTPERVRRVMNCGVPIGDTEVLIVDPHTRVPCAPMEVGEIWLSGSGLASGYWRREEDTARTFRACTGDKGPCVRTGDLGFVKGGELYVTGRIKDVIIIRGRNHYPQDIELTVAHSHPALRPGYGAAFGLTVDGHERLIVVQEVRRSHLRCLDVGDVVGNILETVIEQHELQVSDVVLVKPGNVPRTSSGKVRRSLCRERYLSGKLEIVNSGRAAAPPVETTRFVVSS